MYNAGDHIAWKKVGIQLQRVTKSLSESHFGVVLVLSVARGLFACAYFTEGQNISLPSMS